MKLLMSVSCAVLALGFVGCGGSDSSSEVAESTTTLTSSERKAVREVLEDTGGVVFGFEGDDEDGMLKKVISRHLSAMNISTRASTTESDLYVETCDDGGTISSTSTDSISGDNIPSSGITAKTKSVFKDCKVKDEEDDRLLTLNGTLNGDASLKVDENEATSTTKLSLKYSLKGGLAIEGNKNGAGDCGIDMNMSAELIFTGNDMDNGTGGGTSKGKICGEKYEQVLDME